MIINMLIFLVVSQGSIESLQMRIQQINPHISAPRARSLAQNIDTVAQKYELDRNLLSALIEQESMFHTAKRTCYVVQRFRQCQTSCDLGLAQINFLWVKKWKLDETRLLKDDSYNLDVLGRILANLRHYYGEDEPTWWGRYHSGTPSKRRIYERNLTQRLAFK